jgi:hypothetical protein
MAFKNSVLTSRKTQPISITKSNYLMLFKEIIAVYCENHTKTRYILLATCRVNECESSWYIQLSLGLLGCGAVYVVTNVSEELSSHLSPSTLKMRRYSPPQHW